MRRRLEPPAPARRPGGLALAAAAIVLLAAILWLRPVPSPIPAGRASRGFQVSRVESRGRPSAAMVLRPDQNTLMVIVPD